MKKYLPEGTLFNSMEMQKKLKNEQTIRDAYQKDEIIEARAIRCDNEHNLYVDLGEIEGFMPHSEGAIGLNDGSVRDIAIISRVNKPVAFKITDFIEGENGKQVALLSRRKLQEECTKNYLNTLKTGDIIDAKVTHIEPFGAFCDIGCGISALLPIDGISVSRIPSPSARLSIGLCIRVIVKTIQDGRITLSHKELLGTWEENANNFKIGETVPGIIRSVEKYGIFVELAPNLAGLAEFVSGPKQGDNASVYIKSINPERMKIKLIIVDCFEAEYQNSPIKYYFEGEHIDFWSYSPPNSSKLIETIF
ncbi:MAG: S1 RNA-binding domain-containing protein [Oscillospiraceae bacterium]